jgi:hypothetical protein
VTVLSTLVLLSSNSDEAPTLMVLSTLPEASVLPSGEKATEETPSTYPLSVASSCLVGSCLVGAPHAEWTSRMARPARKYLSQALDLFSVSARCFSCNARPISALINMPPINTRTEVGLTPNRRVLFPAKLCVQTAILGISWKELNAYCLLE